MPELDQTLELLGRHRPRSIIKALQEFLYHKDPGIKQRAIKAMGASIAALAEEDMDQARTMMQRFVWDLNDESGGCAWGRPEAMAEAMALHLGLAREFAHLLASFINPEGLYLDYGPLQKGAVWGIARVAKERPGLVRDAAPFLEEMLGAEDPELRELAALALSNIKSYNKTGE